VSPDLLGLTCAECERRLDAYVDEELDAPARAAVERHLRECPACRSKHDRKRALALALRQQLPTYAVPDLLRARIDGALRAASTRDAPTTTERAVPATAVPVTGAPMTAASMTAAPTAAAARRWRWAALAASALFVVSTTYGVVATRSTESPDDAIAHDVLASHVRSLMPGHLTDVASSNRHNVKPWFNGRLDYSPPVYDFSGAGFPLVGGRMDYVGSRAVAVLVYQRRQHVISLFVWPAERQAASAPVRAAERAPERTRQGYHLLPWTRGGMTRWAVSDLNAEELRDFARLEQRTDSLASAREGAEDSR
jgi:anti-sigma factor RsiW